MTGRSPDGSWESARSSSHFDQNVTSSKVKLKSPATGSPSHPTRSDRSAASWGYPCSEHANVQVVLLWIWLSSGSEHSKPPLSARVVRAWRASMLSTVTSPSVSQATSA